MQQERVLVDGRTSTDENPTSLVYSWNFGLGRRSRLGPIKDLHRARRAPSGHADGHGRVERGQHVTAAQNITIVEPTGNTAPVPTFTTGCTGLSCAVNSTGTADPQTGDTIAYSWNWGDGTALSAGATPSAHTYAAAGTYTITLTTTDGWGKAASTTRNVTLTEPVGNAAPTAAFTVSCATYTVCQTNSAGTVDQDGDAIKYAWTFGEANFGGVVSTTNTSTASNPSHTYDIPGTYTITLTATNAWASSPSTTKRT